MLDNKTKNLSDKEPGVWVFRRHVDNIVDELKGYIRKIDDRNLDDRNLVLALLAIQQWMEIVTEELMSSKYYVATGSTCVVVSAKDTMEARRCGLLALEELLGRTLIEAQIETLRLATPSEVSLHAKHG